MKYFSQIKTFIEAHDRHLSFGALLTGFIVDSLTLTRIDLWFDNLILFSYLTLAGGSLLLMTVIRSGRIKKFLPYVMQYAYGGLFSGYVIFYSKSASLSGSVVFILVLLILLVGNEFFRERYSKLLFRLSIFYVALFSFSIFFIPVLLGRLGDLIFITSGIVSLLLIGGLLHIAMYILDKRKAQNIIKESRKMIFSVIGVIFISFNVLYFTNIIPPIPLSLKESGIYYDIKRTNTGNYQVFEEDLSWYEFYKKDEIKYISGSPIYSYTAIFAPTKIREEIFHKWLRFDEEANKWTIESVISFPITGGRDGGFRGFTLKRNLVPGKWRVDVTTKRDQILGRTTFEVIETSSPPELTSQIR